MRDVHAGMTPDPEDQLIASIQAGDRSALGTLLKRHERRLFNVSLRMVSHRDDAAEVLQDAMLKIIKNIDKFRGDAKFSTWSTRIVMNQSISHLRKRRVRKAGSLEAAGSGRDGDSAGAMLRNRLADEGEPGPSARVEHEEMVEHLRAALARIDEQFRCVIVLRDLEGLDYQQVAEALDVPLGTVKSRLFRARLALRQEMERLDSGAAATAAPATSDTQEARR